MEARVKALEDKFEKIDGKLDALGKDLAFVKGKIDGLPSAAAFGELKGRVDSLPTTAKTAALLAMFGTAVTLALRWNEIKQALGWAGN